MKDTLLILGIMALCGWLTALPMLFVRKASARLRLGMAVLPLSMLLVPLPAFCRRTVTLPAAIPQTNAFTPVERLPVLPADPLPVPHTDGPAFTIGAELIAAVWLVGMALCLLTQLAEWLSLHRHLSERQAVSPEVRALLDELCTEMNIRLKPRIALCPAVDTPLLTGLLRPVILLPDGISADDGLRLILRHELTHHKQGHLLLQALARLAAAVHWFHPLGHLLVRRIPELCEDACDEIISAALTPDERKHYGLVILRFAGGRSCGGCAALAAQRGKDPRRNMERRLKAVMNPKHISPKIRLLAVSMAALVLLGSCGLSYKIAPAAVKQSDTPVSEMTAGDAGSSSEEISEPTPDVSSEPEGEAVSGEEDVSSKETQGSSAEASGPSQEAPETSSGSVPDFSADAKEARLEEKETELQEKLDDLDEKVNELKEKESELVVHSPASCWPLPGHTTITAQYGGSRDHCGIDISGENVSGSPIAAWRAGKVLSAGYDTADGNFVLIDHGDGLCSFYAHCQSLAVKEGDTVTVGQTIAAAGSTGNSTGPHLHFELRQDGSAIDPSPYLPLSYPMQGEIDPDLCGYPKADEHHEENHLETHKTC